MLEYEANEKKEFKDVDIPFGPIGPFMAGLSLTEQFIGGARVSISPNSDGTTTIIVNNSTGAYSGSYHTTLDIPREPGKATPLGTIYQRFIWTQ
jgi:hypothetical protein